MAPGGFRPCCSPCQNLPPIDHVEDELARDLSPVEGFYSGNNFSAPSHDPTSGPTLVSALISALVPAPTLALPSSDELFRQFIKAYLELN